MIRGVQQVGVALLALGCSSDSGPVAQAAVSMVSEQPPPKVRLPPLAKGPLAGRIVVLSPGHGKLLHRDVDKVTPFDWAWQRLFVNGSFRLAHGHFCSDFFLFIQRIKNVVCIQRSTTFAP